LQGRPIVALTDSTAAIENPTGAITVYRRYDKPALGPVGDNWTTFNDRPQTPSEQSRQVVTEIFSALPRRGLMQDERTR
jgi:hypothetical protein